MSRPTKFRPEFVKQAKALCQLGATDPELADFFCVSRRTINYWKTQSPAFAKALHVGKTAADERVKRALFTRATGFEHEETDIRVVAGRIVKTQVTKVFPPDSTACIFWLKNRAGWKDKQDVEHSGGLTLEQLVAQSMKPKTDGSSSSS